MQAGGRRFDSDMLHHFVVIRTPAPDLGVGVLCFVVQVGHEVLCQEDGEGRGEDHAGGVHVHEHLLEHRLVDPAADLWRGVVVGGGEGRREAECLLQVVLDIDPVDLRGCERSTSVGEFRGDALLLLLEEFERDGASEVGLEKFAALGFQPLDATSLALGELLSLLGPILHGAEDLVSDALGSDLVDLERLVAAEHQRLHRVDGEVGQVAQCSPGVTPEAVHVLVGAAAASLGPGERDARTAPAAVKRALQVVGVGPPSFSRLAAAVEQRLDRGEGLDRDEGFVSAVVLDAAPLEHADVDAVVEYVVDRTDAEWLLGSLGRRARAEPLGCECLGQLDQAVMAGCVGLERPADEVTPLGVDLDGADLLAVAQEPDVGVPDGGQARVPAVLGLLVHALLDLACEVL